MGATVTADPLEGPKLKIERANAHINELIALIEGFSKSQPYELFEDVNPSRCLKARFTGVMPAQIQVVIGDILYGLRSALDQLACALAINNGHEPSKTYFPFGHTRNIFESSDVQKKIKRLSPEAISMIHALQPYNGGNDLLWALHSLNLMDKHKALIVVATVRIAQGHFRIQAALGYNVIEAPRWQSTDEEIVVLSYSGSVVNAQVQIISQVAFGDIDVVRDRFVIPTVQQLSDLTRTIVESFEKRFFI